MSLEFIRCPGCGHMTHYQWVTHPSGTGKPYCPECKGTRRGFPAANPILEGLIYRLMAPRASESLARTETAATTRVAAEWEQRTLW
jgi:hypothetical protein